MDETGSFHIKNIGKCSLFVNSKEVPAKKRINLTSGSLIEVYPPPLSFYHDFVLVWVLRIISGYLNVKLMWSCHSFRIRGQIYITCEGQVAFRFVWDLISCSSCQRVMIYKFITNTLKNTAN